MTHIDESKPTILIVEDVRTDALLAARSLRKACIDNPYQIVTNGEQVVDYLAGRGAFGDRHAFPLPNLILLDIKLPKLDGFEVLSWIRSRPEHRSLPVIVLSSSNRPTDEERARELGASGFMVKPLTNQELVGSFRKLREDWSSVLQNHKPATDKSA